MRIPNIGPKSFEDFKSDLIKSLQNIRPHSYRLTRFSIIPSNVIYMYYFPPDLDGLGEFIVLRIPLKDTKILKKISEVYDSRIKKLINDDLIKSTESITSRVRLINYLKIKDIRKALEIYINSVDLDSFEINSLFKSFYRAYSELHHKLCTQSPIEYQACFKRKEIISKMKINPELFKEFRESGLSFLEFSCKLIREGRVDHE